MVSLLKNPEGKSGLVATADSGEYPRFPSPPDFATTKTKQQQCVATKAAGGSPCTNCTSVSDCGRPSQLDSNGTHARHRKYPQVTMVLAKRRKALL